MNKLREFRKKKGYTQEYLANYLGIRQTAYGVTVEEIFK